MEKRINIAELLKYCPKGMELDSPMYDNVTFGCIVDGNCYPVQVQTPEGNMLLSQHGCTSLSSHAKCVIFPKGKTTWEGFHRPFKVGDIVVTTLNNMAIIRKPTEKGLFYVYGLMVDNNFYKDETAKVLVKRLAAEEEKQKLFNAIKRNGYKWNAETKTLEKLIEPKFKVGDRIKKGEKIATIARIYENFYDFIYDSGIGSFTIDLQDEWELVPNKFDITTLKPFESKVLVRDYNNDPWRASFWGCLIDNRYKFNYDTTRGYYKQCIPYESNKHLLGKTGDCDEYYKTWEK